MKNKVLSVRQPYATLICAGVKTIENRTWKTDYRGKLLIHASGDNMSFFDTESIPQKFLNAWYEYIEKDEWNCPIDAPDGIKNAYKMVKEIWKFYGIEQDDPRPVQDWIKQAVKEHGCFFQSAAIIGEAILSDIVDNLYDADDDFAEPDCYYWKMTEPVLYDKPITSVLGHLRLWTYET
jgi:hypothetical protein